jgi:hypothetical protein
MSDANNRRYPESTFEATYPYNQATITRSGHEIHINDTPGKESLRIAHTKGSYAEIDREGRTVVTSVGKAYYYLCDGFSVTVDGHNDLKVSGVMNVNVDGSVNEQTAGNRYLSAGGDFIVGVGGTLVNTTVADKYESVGGDETKEIIGSEYKNIGADSVNQIKGSKTDILNSDWLVTSSGSIEIINDGSIRLKCKNFVIDAETITFNSLSGPVTISAASIEAMITDSVNVSSGSTNLNSSGEVNVTSGAKTTFNTQSADINGAPVKINGVVQVGN